MKRALLLLFVALLIGCSTIATHPAVDTVLGKFIQKSWQENTVIGDGQIGMRMVQQHYVLHWVLVQGEEQGEIIVIPMTKDDWDKTKVGDVIAIPGDGEGGTSWQE